MKTLGVILLIAGILMIVFTGINFTTEKEVIDAGPIEINKKENHSVNWPTYAGGGVAIIGVIMLIAAGRKKGS